MLIQNRLHRCWSRTNERRQGAAVAELAVVLPLLMLILLGTIEICSLIFLQQTLRVCAYEGARVALVPGAKLENVTEAINQLVEDRNIDGVSIVIDPPDFDQQAYGSVLRVAVSADASSNSLVTTWFIRNRQLSSEIHMMVER